MIKSSPLTLIETSMNAQLEMDRKIKRSKSLFVIIHLIISIYAQQKTEISVITKRSIKRHLKNCKKIMHNNKVCQCCHKTFLKKSNRDRHVKQFLENSNNTKCEDIDLNLNDGEIDKEFPTMQCINREFPTMQCIDRCNVWFWS